MKTWTALSIVGAILLSACSITPGYLRENVPKETFTSTKSAKEVSLCIVKGWEGFPASWDVQFRPSEVGFQITTKAPGGGSVDNLVDVQDVPGGSKTIRFASPNAIHNDLAEKMGLPAFVKNCQ